MKYPHVETTLRSQRQPAESVLTAPEQWQAATSELRRRRSMPSSGYSIRIPLVSEAVACGKCGRIFRAGGPTGFSEAGPICDGCLLIGDRQLGMVLTMIAVCRYYGGMTPTDEVEERLHQRELAAFARIYEGFAGHYGPPRPWSNFFTDGSQGPG